MVRGSLEGNEVLSQSAVVGGRKQSKASDLAIFTLKLDRKPYSSNSFIRLGMEATGSAIMKSRKCAYAATFYGCKLPTFTSVTLGLFLILCRNGSSACRKIIREHGQPCLVQFEIVNREECA